MISNINPQPSGRRPQSQPDPEEDEDSDEDIAMTDAHKHYTVQVVDDVAARKKRLAEERLAAESEERRKQNDEHYLERTERNEYRTNSRTSLFLKDPEASVKIFLSANFRDRGFFSSVVYTFG